MKQIPELETIEYVYYPSPPSVFYASRRMTIGKLPSSSSILMPSGKVLGGSLNIC